MTIWQSTLCPYCNRLLSRCSICLATLGIVYDPGNYAEDGDAPRGVCRVFVHFLFTDDDNLKRTMRSSFAKHAGTADTLRI